jgi:hypothetical protein
MTPLEVLVSTKVRNSSQYLVDVILAGKVLLFWICCEYFYNQVSLLVSVESTLRSEQQSASIPIYKPHEGEPIWHCKCTGFPTFKTLLLDK